jgi:lysyl endopeptidase
MTRRLPRGFGLLLCALGLGSLGSAHAATSVRTLNVDLAPKIEAAVTKRDRFAVDVPHIATATSAGSWERENGRSTWRYAVRIPTAVSMSFHAGAFALPGGATLQVTAADGSRFIYVGTDGGGGELWSRIHRGDSLSFELSVPSALESQVDFVIASLQAGYRGLGGGAPDHPHFSKLTAAGAASMVAAACSENFSCHVNAANRGNGDATAAIVVGGVSLCSATLINNLRNDATPYLLSARHCKELPHSGVTVYWDAVTPCGTPLASIYSTQTPAYIHTSDTVFEQQDVWLIRLTGPVNGTHVYFAGWDATGGAFVGGYSPHHALGRTRQYTGWYGQAVQQTLTADTLGVGYDSTYWGVVNEVGNVGAGASGGGLFNPDHRLVGTASLASLVADDEGVCPAASPPAPSPGTTTALYNALAAVWETNADTTSFTNPVTLKSLLDPDNTGVRVSDGFEMLPGVYLSSNPSYGDTGRVVTLTWSGGSATSCVASGGAAGDGWSGARAVNGTYEVIQYTPGLTTYTIRCTDGTRFAIRSIRVTWNESSPQVVLSPADTSGWQGNTMRMYWRSTVVPCTASGGVAGDGWAGAKTATGSLDVPMLQSGDTTYTLNCGSGTRTATQTVQVRAFAPVATLTPTTNNIRVNSHVLVMQQAGGTSCTRTGGAPGDGWTDVTGGYSLRLTSAVAGTFHYTLTCSGGPNGSVAPAVATMDLTFTNDAPAATLTPSRLTAEIHPAGPIADITGPSPYSIAFTWISNVEPCQLTYDGPGTADGAVNPSVDFPAGGTLSSFQTIAGTYEYRITCTNGSDTATATTTVQFNPAPPRTTLRLITEHVASNEPFVLAWNSNTGPCVATGGAPGDGWEGPKSSSNHTTITLTAPGSYLYAMTCGSAPDAAAAEVTVQIEPPAVSFLPHAPQMLSGSGIALGWDSSIGPCVQTGDWASTFTRAAYDGNVAIYYGTGVRTYGIRCGTTSFVEATTEVNWIPHPSVNITADVSYTYVNQPVTLSWTSANAESCEVQGIGAPDWNGPLPISGSRVVTRSAPGTVGFYMNCDGVIDAVVVEWRSVAPNPPAAAGPTVSLTIDHTTRVSGQAVTLSWTTTRAASCRGSEGVNGDNWASVLPVSGTRVITVSGTGIYTWAITCDGAPPAAAAQVSATYSAAPSGGGNPGGGASNGGSGGSAGGGGGRIDPLLLMALLALMSYTASARIRRRLPSTRST